MVGRHLLRRAVILVYTLCEVVQSSPFDRKEFQMAGPNVTIDPVQLQQRRASNKEKRLETIKRMIITNLEIADPVRDMSNVSVPDALIDIFRRRGGVDDEKLLLPTLPPTDRSPMTPLTTTLTPGEDDKTIRADSENPTQCGDGEAVQFRFDEAEEPGKKSPLHVTSANLSVLVRYKKRVGTKRRNRRIEIKIYQLTQDAGPDSPAPTRRPVAITTLRVTVRHTKWQTLFLPTTVVQQVLDSPHKVLCVRIECKDCGNGINTVLVKRRKKAAKKGPEPTRRKRKSRNRKGRSRDKRPKRERKGRKERLSKRRPYLLVQTRPKSSNQHRSVKKRDIHSGRVEEGSETCEVKPLYVDFSELGWNEWIVYPKGYEANYCGGGCSVNDNHSPSNNGQQLINSDVNKSKLAQQKQCCTPSVQRPLQLLYYDQDQKLTMTELPDMIIDRCQCS